MNTDYPSHSELESSLLRIDPEANDCRIRITDLRRAMDEACDQGNITITQWRSMLDRIANLQSRCPSSSGSMLRN